MTKGPDVVDESGFSSECTLNETYLLKPVNDDSLRQPYNSLQLLISMMSPPVCVTMKLSVYMKRIECFRWTDLV